MINQTETVDSNWKTLYKVGGIAALVMAVLIPIQVIIFIISPPPTTIIGWFTLFQKNSLLGLLDMDLLLMIDQLLMTFVFLAFYSLLRKVNQSLMAIALMLGLMGIIIYFSSAVAFEMLNLSNLYAQATTVAEKALYLSAGQAMYSTWQGTTFDVSYVIGGIAMFLISVVMLRSSIFSKTIAYLGIVMSLLMLAPPTVGMIGMILALISLLPLEIWGIMVAKRLLELSK